MKTVSDDVIVHQLSWRYATKQFDPSQKIAPEHWKTLEAAMVNAPSSYGLQPWQFVVVTDQAMKDQLPDAAWGQIQPRDCSHFVVIAARKATDPAYVQKLIEAIAAERAVSVETLESYRQAVLSKTMGMQHGHLEWNARQCYIALGFLLQAAAMLGIDACPMEGIVCEKMNSLLGLADTEYTAVVGCALGYRSASDKYSTAKKVRYPAHELVKRI